MPVPGRALSYRCIPEPSLPSPSVVRSGQLRGERKFTTTQTILWTQLRPSPLTHTHAMAVEDETHLEEQALEIEALESIYMDDLQELANEASQPSQVRFL